MQITLDIETIPTDDAEVIAELSAEISPPKTMSKAETIAKWEAEEKPSAVLEAQKRTAFDGTYGRIICIGYALEDAPPVAVIGEEKNIIAGFFKSLPQSQSRHQIVGHNVIGFDLRFLWQRSIIHGIRPHPLIPWAAKPWDGNIQDTMLMWHPDRERRISLDKLCRALKVPTPKTGMDGSKVWGAYKAGDIDKIAAYCIGDIHATRECFKRMT